MSKKGINGVIIVLLVAVGLFVLSNYLSPNRALIKKWQSAGVDCLPNGHANLAEHIHQILYVEVDGVDQDIPSDVGVLSNCLAELHTHEGEPGKIHLETATAGKEFKLEDFFTVWGENYIRPGYANPVVVVNGATTTESGNVTLEDGQVIQVLYVGSPQKTQE